MSPVAVAVSNRTRSSSNARARAATRPSAVTASERLQDAQPQVALVNRIGGCGEIKQDRSSLPHELSDRVAIIKALGPEVFVIPDVLTDGDAELLAAQREDALRFGRLEVTVFVEHIVGGKQHLVLLKQDSALGHQGGNICQGLAGGVLRPAG